MDYINIKKALEARESSIFLKHKRKKHKQLKSKSRILTLSLCNLQYYKV